MTETEKEIVRFLQEDLPLTPRPYQELAQRLGISEEAVTGIIRKMQADRVLKRISVALYHTRVGYKVNSMVVWDVEEDRLDAVSEGIRELPYVTHCYSRNPAPEFDYNYYTMIHAHTQEELDQHLREMEAIIRPVKYESLKTVKELKKKGMKYFI